MGQAHRFDCEAGVDDCQFIVQSEDETKAIELARNHLRDVHGVDYPEEVLRSDHPKIV